MNLVMPSSSAAADAFGAQDCGSTYTSFGGTRIAEYALFTNMLTAAERDTMTGYLRIKWLGPTSCSVKVAPGASLVVDESANLRLPVAADGADVTVSTCTRVGGELDSAVYAAGPTMRLDASVTNTMAIVPMNGTNFVESWKDVDGRKWYAVEEHTTGKNGQRTDPEKRMPYLNPVLSQNGLPVVDLGSFIYTTNTNGHGGAFNYFGFKSLSVAEYMSVISDTEDLKTTTAGQYGPSYMSQRDAGKFDGTNDGRRGKTVKNAYPALFFNPGASYNNPCKNGTNYVNGVQLAYTASPPEGFNVVNIRPRSAITCNLIGRHMRGASSNNVDC